MFIKAIKMFDSKGFQNWVFGIKIYHLANLGPTILVEATGRKESRWFAEEGGRGRER
jgi:hypothetical protein